MFFANKYKFLYRIISFSDDGFYIENLSCFDSIKHPFFIDVLLIGYFVLLKTTKFILKKVKCIWV